MDKDKEVKIDDSYESMFNLDSLIKGKGGGITMSEIADTEDKPKKKRTRKKKDSSDTETVIVTPVSQGELSMVNSNVPYSTTYNETTDMIKTTLSEIDMYSASVREELNHIKNSKTMKNKYNYIVDLTSAGSNLLSTKLTAIKEMNKIITDSHNLELKRQKDLAAIGANQENDDKHMMDLYTSVMRMGVGSRPAGAFSINQMDLQNPAAETAMYGVGDMNGSGQMSPEQFAMRAEVLDKDIKVCVIYNTATGEKWFEGRNTRTGEAVPNLPVPDSMFLQDTQVYVAEGVARNVNLDKTYPLITVNGNVNIY